jgi:Uma2 family endonuclease
MTRPAPVGRMSYAEYASAEAKNETRHEFLNGEVFAMAGGTPEHAALAASLARVLGNALIGKPCRAFSSDLRVRISETGLTTYPDLSVACGQIETSKDDTNALTNPVVLVEILSDSTEGYDRGAKFAHYRRLESLQEYVLVSQAEPLIEVWRRNERGFFEIVEARKGERAQLRSIGIEIDVDAVYANPLIAAGA